MAKPIHIMAEKYSFFHRNGLSLVVLFFMFLFLSGQFYTGWKTHNEERQQENLPALSASQYLTSAHFVSSTFENWESEFLQMAIYVLLTVGLRQKGSSESKKMTGKEEVDRVPKPHPRAPWPVRKGGLWLKLYSNSLSIAFAILFLFSLAMHFSGSLINHNEERVAEGLAKETVGEYMISYNFWFESFQNWQSEFLAVGAIVLLSIWLRQKGSPESKPVDAPNDQTGG